MKIQTGQSFKNTGYHFIFKNTLSLLTQQLKKSTISQSTFIAGVKERGDGFGTADNWEFTKKYFKISYFRRGRGC